MAIEQAMVARVVSRTAVTALVSSRVYPKTASQNKDMPYITYQQITGGPVNVISGPTGTYNRRYQFDIIAATYSAVKAIGLALENALNGWADKASNPSISSCLMVDNGEQDDFDEPTDGSEVLVQRLIQEYSIWYKQH